MVTHTLGPIAYHQGDTGEAWSQIMALLPHGPDTEPGSSVLLDALMLQRLAVELCLDADDTDSADLWLRANDRWLSWSGSVLGRAENHLIWAERHRAAGDTGTAWRCANLAVGDTSGVVGDGPGLTNPLGAEIHFVVRDHGPVQAGLLGEQLTTFGGGCNNAPEGPGEPGNFTCVDLQFAAHLQ